MASPFPGMDPYLEGELWQEFHETFASEIRNRLLSRLKPKYVALLAKRYAFYNPTLGILQPPERIIYPDVHVVKPTFSPGLSTALLQPLTLAGSGMTVLQPTIEVISPVREEVPLLSVEIRDVAQRRLVTVIELLSPVNKTRDGAAEYQQRRLDLLQTSTHLLEIDLLCKGTRIEVLGQLPPAPYYLYLSRANARPVTQVWALALQNPLPTIPVPLLHPDPDVPLDLQAAITACFDLVGYENLLDYSAPPPTELTEEEKTWASETLISAGYR